MDVYPTPRIDTVVTATARSILPLNLSAEVRSQQHVDTVFDILNQMCVPAYPIVSMPD